MKIEQWLIHLILPLAVCLAIGAGWIYPEFQHYRILKQSTALMSTMKQCMLASPETLPVATVQQLLQPSPNDTGASIRPQWQSLGTGSPEQLSQFSMEATGPQAVIANTLLSTLQLSPTVHIQAVSIQSAPYGNTTSEALVNDDYRLNLTSFPQ